jgi:signal transduction histidine kinase
VRNLTGILNDFLSLDKLETGALQSQPILFDLMVCTQETCDQLAPTLRKHQQIRYHHQGQTEIYLDKHILTNVLLNLLSNASKYSGEGKAIELTTRFLDGNLEITVKDQGIGISKEDQKHLFKRFFRSKNAINIAGTGLGLNIVKKYVEMLDGEIEFHSELDIGSTFNVKLTQPLRT